MLTLKALSWTAGLLLIANLVQFGWDWAEDRQHATVIAELEGALKSITTERDAADAKVEELVTTNATASRAVEDLAAKLDAAIAETEALDALLLDKEVQLFAMQRARDDALARLTDQRDADYANDPSCAAWGAAPVCGRITDGVLVQWRAAQAGRH